MRTDQIEGKSTWRLFAWNRTGLCSGIANDFTGCEQAAEESGKVHFMDGMVNIAVSIVVKDGWQY